MMVALTIGSLGFIFFGWLSDHIGRAQHHDLGLRARDDHLLAGLHMVGHFPRQSSDADHPGALPGDPRYNGVRANRGVLGRALPGPDTHSSMSMPYHIGNGWFGGGVPFIGTAIAQATGIALGALFYPMAVAAAGVVVSLAFIRESTHKIRIWDEVGGGAPPLVPDQP
jgi:hypothetical protein